MSLYQDLRKVKRYVSYLGSRAGFAALTQEARSSAVHELTIKHPQLSKSVVVRTNSSDIETFGKVIAEREYYLPELRNVRTIIDAGANIGLASVFFAETFPGARIIALEPESSNFELLKRNTAPYPNIVCLKKALWRESGTITIVDPGDGNWGFRTSNDDLTNVKRVDQVDCMTVLDLMKQFDFPRIDLLKVDIEGSEKEVFADAVAWIGQVDTIVVELHDRFKRGCSKAFYDATVDFAHEIHKGENVFVFRVKPPAN
jgi:FkbM family methyltransferase